MHLGLCALLGGLGLELLNLQLGIGRRRGRRFLGLGVQTLLPLVQDVIRLPSKLEATGERARQAHRLGWRHIPRLHGRADCLEVRAETGNKAAHVLLLLAKVGLDGTVRLDVDVELAADVRLE